MITDPKALFPEITSDYKGLFGEDLLSIILYGSAASGDYQPAKSDINFMIVLSETGIDRLDQALKTVAKWQKRRVSVPLFLTESYVESSLDVFPIEYLNFKQNHVLVYGKDILKDLSFDPEHTRLQCEREIKGKLLLLREAFLNTEGKGKALKQVIGQSVSAFIAIFEALLFLKGEELPSEKRKIARAACESLNLDYGLFEKLLDVKEEKLKPVDQEIRQLFMAYLKEVRKLSNRVDRWGGEHG